MKGFFAGALIASPLTAIILWLVTGFQSTVDTKVERSVTAAELAEAKAGDEFDQRWQQLGGAEPLKCDPTEADKVAALKERLATLEQQLSEARAADNAKAASINDIVASKE